MQGVSRLVNLMVSESCMFWSLLAAPIGGLEIDLPKRGAEDPKDPDPCMCSGVGSVDEDPLAALAGLVFGAWLTDRARRPSAGVGSAPGHWKCR